MQGMKTDGLSLAYDNTTIIEQLNTAIKTGQITALVGPNGCGKSTLLRGLARLLKPKQGEVLLDGKAIHRLPTKELAKQLGVLPQSPTAPEGLTVYELVAQGRYPHQGFFQQWSANDETVTREAIAITNMVDFADRPLDTLSGGQRQRAWIAMALAQNTPILLLDEPTTFLDIGYQLEVMELIEKLNRERQMTILLVLHDLNQAARYSDRMIVMKAGQIVADGSPINILTAQLIANVFHVQANIVTDPNSGSPVCLPYGTVRQLNENTKEINKKKEQFMITTARLNTPKSASYLKKLCHHFQLKVPVECNAQHGNVQFPAGTCEMKVEPDALLFRVEAEDEAGLTQVRNILDNHIELFTQRDPLQIEWAELEKEK